MGWDGGREIVQGAAVVGSSRPMLHQRLATPLPSFSIADVTKLPGNIIIATASHVSTILPSSSKNAYNRVEFERGNMSRKPKRKRQGKRVELGGVPISLDVIKNRSTGI
jgi:hypothetical protein